MTTSGVPTAIMIGLALAGSAGAQSLGTFRWPLQSHGNIVSTAATRNGDAVAPVDGTAGGADSSSASAYRRGLDRLHEPRRR